MVAAQVCSQRDAGLTFQGVASQRPDTLYPTTSEKAACWTGRKMSPRKGKESELANMCVSCLSSLAGKHVKPTADAAGIARLPVSASLCSLPKNLQQLLPLSQFLSGSKNSKSFQLRSCIVSGPANKSEAVAYTLNPEPRNPYILNPIPASKYDIITPDPKSLSPKVLQSRALSTPRPRKRANRRDVLCRRW